MQNKHEQLRLKIKEAIELSDRLSERETDQYAKCTEELMNANACLYDVMEE